MNISREDILKYHLGGKIGTLLTKPLKGPRDLSLAYTPGVAIPVKVLHENPSNAFTYTAKANLVAVATDGTAVLGLGDVGATAGIPVMEGKAVLFKAFADVDAWPVPLEFCRTGGQRSGKTDVERVIDTMARVSCMYGGINLEDIAAPACFEIERRLDEMLDIPVFHDAQWGTAVITLAGVMNYCEITGRKLANLRIVINGAGAAGIRIADMLKDAGAELVIMCDSKGVISPDRTDLNDMKRRHAARAGARTLGEAMAGAHVFIGVSAADCVTPDFVRSMAGFPAIFAMANPTPEILPDQVAGALGNKPYVMATGRSDYPNQINNVLGFPYLFRGALDVRATTINLEMKRAAAQALASLARKKPDERLKEIFPGETLEFGVHYIVPKPFDRRLMMEVPLAVAKAAIATSVARQTDISGYAGQLEHRAASAARG